MKSHSLRKWIAVWIIFTWVGTTTIATITEISIAQKAKKVPVSKQTKTTKIIKKQKTSNPKRADVEDNEYNKYCRNNMDSFSERRLEEFNKKMKVLKFPTKKEWDSVTPFPKKRDNYTNGFYGGYNQFVYHFEIYPLQEHHPLILYQLFPESYENMMKNLIFDLKLLKFHAIKNKSINITDNERIKEVTFLHFCKEYSYVVYEFVMKINIRNPYYEDYIRPSLTSGSFPTHYYIEGDR